MKDRIKLMIADNNLHFSHILCDFFTLQEDFTVADLSFNGQDTVEKINRIMPDAVLLDIILPNKCGLDILRECQALIEVKKPVFIVLSAVWDQKIIQQAMDLGASLYMIKPVDLDMLASGIRRFLHR